MRADTRFLPEPKNKAAWRGAALAMRCTLALWQKLSQPIRRGALSERAIYLHNLQKAAPARGGADTILLRRLGIKGRRGETPLFEKWAPNSF